MLPSEECYAIIKKYEGFSAAPYVCPSGKLTVGYGHVIRSNENYSNGVTPLSALTILKADVIAACNSVARLVTVPLTQTQFDALVSFTFNLGGGRLQASTLRQRLNRKDYVGAASEFGKWVYGGGIKLPGLILRRADEAALFRRGIAKAGEQQYIVLPWLNK